MPSHRVRQLLATTVQCYKMAILWGHRVLGPISGQRGGTTQAAAGGGGSLSITNNSDGFVLGATGNSTKISGISTLSNTGTGFIMSDDLYITGSSHRLFINGTDHLGGNKNFSKPNLKELSLK